MISFRDLLMSKTGGLFYAPAVGNLTHRKDTWFCVQLHRDNRETSQHCPAPEINAHAGRRLSHLARGDTVWWNMKEIPLTQCKVALVDDEDYEELRQSTWYAAKMGGMHRAVRRVMTPKGQRTQYMHRVILHPPSGLEIDHIDGNPLNNQKANLRIADRSLNLSNSRTRRVTKHKLPMGVTQNKSSSRYYASICVGYRKIRLGSFTTSEAANKAYLLAREEVLKLKEASVLANIQSHVRSACLNLINP